MSSTIVAERPAPEAPPGDSSAPPGQKSDAEPGFLKRHPVLAYYLLTFAISWGGVLLLVGGPGAIPGTVEQIDRLIWLVVLVLELGPPIAGLVLTGLVDGRAGYRDLLARLLTWRVGLRWYAVALLTAPLLSAAVLLALSLASPVYLPAILTTGDRAFLVLQGVTVGLVGGFGEELGWTGFAVPRLRRRRGVLATGLVVGVLWAVWHYLVTPAWVSGAYTGGLPLTLFLTVNGVACLVGQLPAYRVLMVWVYDRTGSLLVAMLMHASLIASTLFIFAPEALAGIPFLIWPLVFAAALWIAVGAITVTNAGQLSLRRPTPVTEG